MIAKKELIKAFNCVIKFNHQTNYSVIISFCKLGKRGFYNMDLKKGVP